MNHKKTLVIVVSLVAVAIVCVLGAYRYKLGHLEWTGDSAEPWGQFGDYVGGLLNPIFALVNAAAVVFIGFTVHRMESARQDEAKQRQDQDNAERRAFERRSNTVHLIDKFQNLQFYKEVSAPVWEIFVKWRHWKGKEGNQYRFSVVSGQIHFQQLNFESPHARQNFGHNFVRFTDHFHPADYVPPKLRGNRQPEYVQSVLSEHQALTCWLEFWGNVSTMVEAELIDVVLLRRSLSDWYTYWLELVVELRYIVEALNEQKLNTSSLPDSIIEPVPNWIAETKALEEFFFLPERAQWYSEVLESCKRHAERTIVEIRPFIAQRLEVNQSNADQGNAGAAR